MGMREEMMIGLRILSIAHEPLILMSLQRNHEALWIAG